MNKSTQPYFFSRIFYFFTQMLKYTTICVTKQLSISTSTTIFGMFFNSLSFQYIF
ncbi:hypothetical protein BD408DRAFT_425272 [Parasitella parasitica]|nr:hypothetical protein BD408DRAFT_425272 [Parasitella parasitica]